MEFLIAGVISVGILAAFVVLERTIFAQDSRSRREYHRDLRANYQEMADERENIKNCPLRKAMTEYFQGQYLKKTLSDNVRVDAKQIDKFVRIACSLPGDYQFEKPASFGGAHKKVTTGSRKFTA